MIRDQPVSLMNNRSRRTAWAFVLAVVVVVLALGSYLRFNIVWGDYGTGDWLAYWSIPRGLLFDRGYYDMPWLADLQQSLGYPERGAKEYEVWLLWNPPPLVTLLMPFGALNFTSSTLSWIACSALLYGYASAVFNRQLAEPLPEWAAFIFPLGFLPFASATFWGQITPVLAALLVYAWLAQRRGHQTAVGILLVPLLLKPHLFFIAVPLLLLVALRRRQWATFYAFAGFGALLTVVAFILDPAWLTGWLAQGSPNEWQTIALWDMLQTGFDLPGWIQYVGMPLVLLVALYRYRRTEEVTPHLLGEATLLSIISSPYLWHHDVIVTLPAALWLAGKWWGWGLRWPLLMITVLNIWLMPLRDLTVRVVPYVVLYLALWLWTGRWHTRRPEARKQLISSAS